MATPTDEEFQLARLIACCAAKLDDLKVLGTPEQQTEARGCIETLHDVAENLAGDRKPEIYDKREMVEEMRAFARAHSVEAQLRSVDLAPCPFCGRPPDRELWHGGSPEKTMVSCGNEECHVQPVTTGETPQDAADHWNRRADQARQVC